MADLSFNDGLISLRRRAKSASYGLWAYLVVNATALGAAIVAILGFIVGMPMPGETEKLVVGFVAIGYALLAFLIALFLIVVIPLWVFRAWKNLIALRLDGLNYSAGWATGSFFVPLVNLAVPFMAMRELHNRSHGEDAYWARASVGDVTSWWACWLGGTFVTLFVQLAQVFNRNGAIMIVAHPVVWGLTALFGAVLQLAAAWFLIRVVRDITAAQGSSVGISQTFA